jgi:hypothetical protein
MSLYLMCTKNHGADKFKLIITKKDQLCNISIVKNPSQNTEEFLFLTGVSGIVLFGIHSNPESPLKFGMHFYDQYKKEIWSSDWGNFIVSNADIQFVSGLSGGGNYRNMKGENLWKSQLDWEVKPDDPFFDEYVSVRNFDKLLIGPENFIKHFKTRSTTGNPYICLI